MTCSPYRRITKIRIKREKSENDRKRALKGPKIDISICHIIYMYILSNTGCFSGAHFFKISTSDLLQIVGIEKGIYFMYDT